MAVQEKRNQDAVPVKAKLEERFITTVQGKQFVVYAGLLDLAHQKGIQTIQVDVVQYPTKDNGLEAICRATIESKEGETFIECGDAKPRNVNPKIAGHLLRMAATRAKARALRDFTNIGMTCLEELGDLDEVTDHEKTGNGKSRTSEIPKVRAGNGKQDAVPASTEGERPKAPAAKEGNGGSKRSSKTAAKDEEANGNPRDNSSGPKPSSAQIRAIENLARRRNISSQELEEMVQQQFGTTLPNINSSEASNFIRLLQQSA